MMSIDWPTLSAAMEYFIPERKCTRTLMSFMGAGEAILNQDLFFDCQDKMGQVETCYGIATMGPSVEQLAGFTNRCITTNSPTKIHYSIHHPSDRERLKYMPRAACSTDILSLLWNYRNNSNSIAKSRVENFHSDDDLVELHYTMIDGWNDSDDCLSKMISLCSEYDFKLKLLYFRPRDNMNESKKLNHWIRELRVNSIKFKSYNPPGEDIGSACGMFPDTAV